MSYEKGPKIVILIVFITDFSDNLITNYVVVIA